MNDSRQMNSKEDEFLFYSSGGFDFLENYLCALYGEQRGLYLNNIQRYYSGEEFNNICSIAYSVDQIPEITEAQIHNQIIWDDCLRKKHNTIISLIKT